jgi:triacylglycerol esterase/lipase EstA (alpha/beta hydrolase family)
MSLRPRPRTAIAICLLTTAGLAAGGTGAARAGTSPHPADALPVTYSFAAGFAAGFATPTTPPPGANDFGCTPSSAHPYPVILVHGTF